MVEESHAHPEGRAPTGDSGAEPPAQSGLGTSPAPESSEGAAATPPEPTAAPATSPTGEPDSGADDSDAETSARTARIKKARTWVAAFLGLVVSSLVAAVVSNYFDEWTSSGAVPGGRALYAESQVWWDLSRDVRTVEMPGAVSLRQVELYGPDPNSQLDALAKNGGVSAGMMRIRLTLMNFSKSPVIVTGVRARVTSQKPVPPGPSFSCGGSQGSTGVTRVKLDLGSSGKAAEEYDGDKLVGQYPAEQIQLAKQDEPAIFDMKVTAGRASYAYVIEIHYTQGKNKGKILVDDGGKPFALAPLNDKTQYRCDNESGKWVRS